jgi:hypothetical protein
MQNSTIIVSKAGSLVKVRWAGSSNAVFAESKQEGIEKLRSGVRMYPNPRPHEVKGR